MTQAITISLDGAHMVLHGGNELRLRGELALVRNVMSIVTGMNGSGKTLLLGVLGRSFGHPVGPIRHAIQLPRLQPPSAQAAKVSAVREDPLSSFVGGTVADEFRIIYGNEDVNEAEFSERLSHLLRDRFGIEEDILTRDSKSLSGGERQLLALAMAALTSAEILLLDEPFARLSRRNADRAIKVLQDMASARHIVLTSHREHGTTVLDTDNTKALHEVTLESGVLSVKSSKELSCTSSPTRIQEVALDRVAHLVSKASFESERSRTSDFEDLPTRSVRLIHGSGECLFEDQFAVEFLAGEMVVSTAHHLGVHAGLNILYGDNGSGKTIAGRFLAGMIPRDRAFFKGRQLFARGNIPAIRYASFRGGNLRRTTVKKLGEQGESLFLPAEPEDFLSEELVADELKVLGGRDDEDEVMKVLESHGVLSSKRTDQLSFGQKKLLSLFALPKKVMLIVLDEPFSNLADTFQLVMRELIERRIQAGDWTSVVISSNRPEQSLATFCASPAGNNALGA